MTVPRTIVIVGASLAGAKAAETLRADGFDGRVVLVGAEAERPYERPPLSKGYLQGETARDSVYVHPEGFYAEREIELMAGRQVSAIDPVARTASLADGQVLGWDRLLLATGAEPRRLAVPGAGLDGVHHLRVLADSDRLRATLEAGGRLVVVGAGWIGSEVGASARQLGMEVTILERSAVPLEHVLGPTVGRLYADLHRDRGVDLVTGVEVAALEGADRVERVRLADGRAIDCSAVVVGVGAVPRTALAEAAGLAVSDGITVDATLRTSAPDVYAAGDVANAIHPFYDRRVRAEHWANALNQGPAAARNMLGAEEPYERIPYFFSDQYDVGMEYSGLARGSDQVVFRGDPASRELIAFWIADERVTAGMNVNVWDVAEQIQALIRSRAPIDPALLGDPSVPLEALLPAPARG